MNLPTRKNKNKICWKKPEKFSDENAAALHTVKNEPGNWSLNIHTLVVRDDRMGGSHSPLHTDDTEKNTHMGVIRATTAITILRESMFALLLSPAVQVWGKISPPPHPPPPHLCFSNFLEIHFPLPIFLFLVELLGVSGQGFHCSIILVTSHAKLDGCSMTVNCFNLKMLFSHLVCKEKTGGRWEALHRMVVDRQGRVQCI